MLLVLVFMLALVFMLVLMLIPQVECVRVAAGRNLTFVLTQPQEKSFLVLMLVREVASMVRGAHGKAALLLHQPEQVALWSSFLTR